MVDELNAPEEERSRVEIEKEMTEVLQEISVRKDRLAVLQREHIKAAAREASAVSDPFAEGRALWIKREKEQMKERAKFIGDVRKLKIDKKLEALVSSIKSPLDRAQEARPAARGRPNFLPESQTG